MARKIPEHELTEAQIRRRERNARYRLKVVDPIASHDETSHEKSHKTQIAKDTVARNRIHVYRLVNISAQGCLLLGICALLIYFQASVYLADNMSRELSWAIACLCELSLIYLSINLWRGWASRLLFAILFTYSLGSMSYGVKKNETINIEQSSDKTLILSQIDKTQQALDLAISRKESGNTSRYMKALDELRQEMKKTPQNAGVSLIKIQSYGLILLRAILMLMAAFIIHNLRIDIQKGFMK